MLPVAYLPPAERYFRKIRDKTLKNKFKKAIASIRENPLIGDAKSGDLKGLYCLDVYHNELAYRISPLEKGEMVIVVVAGTSENFYKELKRYLK